MAVVFQCFFVFPFAEGKQHVFLPFAAPKLEVEATGEGPNVGTTLVENLQEVVDFFGAESHFYDAFEGGHILLVDFCVAVAVKR